MNCRERSQEQLEEKVTVRQIEDQLRSANISQLDKIKSRDSVAPFTKGGMFRSPPQKNSAQEGETGRMEDKEKGTEDRQMKRRREPKSLEEKLDNFLADG